MGLKRRLARAFTLTELLVVLCIMIVLVSILAPALGAFTHTSRVIAAADSIASMLRQARFYAISHGVQVIPHFLRSKNGNFTAVYAAKVGRYYCPGDNGQNNGRWALDRKALDLPQLEKGAFVVLTVQDGDVSNMDLNQADAEAFPPEGKNYWSSLFHLTVGYDHSNVNDQTKYTFSTCGPFHNTRLAMPTMGIRDVHMVISNTQVGASEVSGLSAAAARDYTISGVVLPNKVALDIVTTTPGETNGYCGHTCGMATAQAAVFKDRNFEKSKYLPFIGANGVRYYPVFHPIFMPDGRVAAGGADRTGANRVIYNMASTGSGFKDQAMRVIDSVSREALYIIVRANGQVEVSKKLPPREWVDGVVLSDLPSYTDVFGSTTSSSSTTSTTTTSSTSTSSSGGGGDDVEAAPPPPPPTPPVEPGGTSSGDPPGFFE